MEANIQNSINLYKSELGFYTITAKLYIEDIDDKTIRIKIIYKVYEFMSCILTTSTVNDIHKQEQFDKIVIGDVYFDEDKSIIVIHYNGNKIESEVPENILVRIGKYT